ncbi:copper transporter 6-like [Andrographis paniculata]|uniref:copper transporter 6-like n=1 Tax=Andrographis paniculata TaxID=175694 RepID=UPI0021E8898C|nr:copper transporter 6-like [Andrographis paniculata]
MDNMPGMQMLSPPPHTTMTPANGAQHIHDLSTTMTHMTFYWGKNSEILFSGWPGTRTGMYAVALIVVFVISILVEWLSSCCGRIKGEDSGHNKLCNCLIRTILYGARVALAYLVMLAIMSFNVGVLIVAVAGHAFGFFVFGSGVLQKDNGSDKGFSHNSNC